MKTNAPGAVSSLVCGIISIVLCWVPIVGLVLGIIAIMGQSRAKKKIYADPENYEGGGLAIAGLVCGIVGTASSALYNIFWVVALLTVGAVVNEAGSFDGSW
ncbi:MAG: DUF4190 domain-containing protein [Verrucomicrobiaceae bacterium]|nr:DUF4190 domain-containing protein [Verrucomicrobiaceae bacterium]